LTAAATVTSEPVPRSQVFLFKSILYDSGTAPSRSRLGKKCYRSVRNATAR